MNERLQKMGPLLRSRPLRIGSSIVVVWLLLAGAAFIALQVPPVSRLPGYPDAERVAASRPSQPFEPLSGEFIRQQLGLDSGVPTQSARRVVQSELGDGRPAQGVTAEEVTVVAYFDEGSYGVRGQYERTPAAGTFVDIDTPPKPPCPPADTGNTDPKRCDHVLVRVLKGFSGHFNRRSETFGRHVHYWAYFASAQSSTRISDATRIWARLKPFAAINQAEFGGLNESFNEAMADYGVVTFDSLSGSRSSESYRSSAPYLWSYWPDVERWARLYSSYVCARLAPFPVKRYGNPSGVGAPNGQGRTFGIWYPTDPRAFELTEFAHLVMGQLRDCGVEIVEEATYANEGYAVDASEPGTDAVNAVLKFQGRVTTVLYIGTEGRFSATADALRYYPEIVVAGDLNNDNNLLGRTQNTNVWRNARAMTYHVRIGSLLDSPGYRAYADGTRSPDESAGFFAREQHPDHLLMFEGIKRAGASLTPTTFSRGLHAIHPRRSDTPFEPALFFERDDYTFIKDAAEQWWDPQHRVDDGTSDTVGCWRMTSAGRRSLAGEWPRADEAFEERTAPCTRFGGSIKIRTA